MKNIKTYEQYSTVYYTTSHPMDIDTFIEIEVQERQNYDIDEVNEWIKKYNINKNSKLLWVSKFPHIAARYQMLADDWNNSKDIYEKNPEEYKVIAIDSIGGILIQESDDGDDGYLMILNN